LIRVIVGYKLACAFINCDPFSGDYYGVPTPDTSAKIACLSPSMVRRLANILDALLEFASTWLVVSFPFFVLLAIFWFPLCY